MAKADYYSVLGVSRDASQEDIRTAYRKLARQHHPDVSKAPDAQERFTRIQEAYAVLSDETKRRQYDRFGHAGPASRSWAGEGGGTHVDIDAEDLGSVFDAFFGGGGGGGEPFGGFRSRAGRTHARPRPSPPREVMHDLDLDFETAAKGGKCTMRIVHDGQTKSIEVSIPKGIDDGAKLRIRNGLGDKTDLILRVRIAAHPLFTRRKLDLSLDLPVTIAEATLGAKVLVPTLDGPVELTIPSGTSGRARLRLKGRGIANAKGETGDLYATLKIMAPDASTLSDEDREALTRIGARSQDIRSGAGWPQLDRTS